MTRAACARCGRTVAEDDGYRAVRLGPAPASAVLCRLEHAAAWGLRGAVWGTGAPPPEAAEPTICAACGDPLGSERFALVRVRGSHRIPDGFCSLVHLVAWARGGGRYGA